jgi:hypothetical protein
MFAIANDGEHGLLGCRIPGWAGRVEIAPGTFERSTRGKGGPDGSGSRDPALVTGPAGLSFSLVVGRWRRPPAGQPSRTESSGS